MGKFIDLTGQIFGELLIERLAVRNVDYVGPNVRWWCKCSCGALLLVRACHLVSGHTTKCKHCRIPSNFVSLVGQRFGSLVLTEYIKNKGKYKCICDCGNEILSTAINLKSGNTKSCGCQSKLLLRQSAISKYRDRIINGISFIEPISELDCSGHIIWKLKCICGNIFERPAASIVSGHTKSCGCLSNTLRSKSLGGTGIPYENYNLYEMIRSTNEYALWRNECLKRANYTCELSNNISHDVQVHHIIPLNILVDTYNITKDNISEFNDILFDISNGIVLSTAVHQEFHQIYGSDTNYQMLQEYKEFLDMENI